LDVRTLTAQQSALPAADLHVLMSHSALTEDLRALGRFGEALESARTAREGSRKTYGDEHADSLAAAAVLADVLRLTGDHGAARALHQAVWQAWGTSSARRTPQPPLAVADPRGNRPGHQADPGHVRARCGHRRHPRRLTGVQAVGGRPAGR
jgi:hypothetical protein